MEKKTDKEIYQETVSRVISTYCNFDTGKRERISDAQIVIILARELEDCKDSIRILTKQNKQMVNQEFLKRLTRRVRDLSMVVAEYVIEEVK